MREEKADLRGKVYIMEKEKKSLELTISTLKAQEVAMKTHIQHLQDELENQDALVGMRKCNLDIQKEGDKDLWPLYNKTLIC